jgi:HEAT repeat protein
MKRLVLVAGITLMLLGCGSEPTFEGRPVRYWKQQLKSNDYMARHRACTMLYTAGSPHADEAVPDLITCLHDPEFLVRIEAAKALGRLDPAVSRLAVPDLIQQLQDPHPGVRLTATEVLQKLDPAAAAQAGVR